MFKRHKHRRTNVSDNEIKQLPSISAKLHRIATYAKSWEQESWWFLALHKIFHFGIDACLTKYANIKAILLLEVMCENVF